MTDLLDIVIAYARAEPLIAAAAGLLLLLIATRKPKLLLFLLLLGLLVGGLLFVIGEMTGVGGAQKSRLYDKGASQDSR